MQSIDLLRLSFDALRANKLRTSLTVFGIVIGVTSVIAIVSIVVGMNAKVTGLINSMGTSTFEISKFSIDDYSSDEAYREARRRKNLRFKDAKAVEKGCEECKYVGAQTVTFRRVKFGSEKSKNIPIVGLTYNVNKITDFEIGEGRFHTEFEDEHKRQTVVLGDKIKRDIFAGTDPIGKILQIGTHKYRVIGTVKPRGSIMGQDFDNFVIIPITTLLKNYGSHRSIDISVNANSEEMVPVAIDQARVILRARRHVAFHEPDNFGVTTSEDWLELYGKITGTVQIVAIAIPLIALIVAGIVVMNIMMVSVTERTREIGIRKSLGAHRKHILLQFMSEALMMSVLGGAIGIALGIFLAKVLSDAGDLPFVISREAILGGVFISTGIGVIFGSYPAYKGAKLDPVDAMRFE
jgi:putative ABC transport system permease protein